MNSCGDEKWKLSKKGRSRSGRSSSSYYSSDGTAAASSSSAVHLSRSYSASVSGTRDVVVTTTTTSSSSSSTTTSSSSQQQPGQQSSSRLSKKCVEAVKEQRARFYIVRRCVSMLVCWRDY